MPKKSQRTSKHDQKSRSQDLLKVKIGTIKQKTIRRFPISKNATRIAIHLKIALKIPIRDKIE